jgi:aminopeptidase
MSNTTFESKLSQYAELAIRVGLNLQPGQHLGLTGRGSGPALTSFMRQVVESAYQAGATYVDAFVLDSQYELSRLQHATQESLDYYPDWPKDRLMDIVEQGGAIMSVSAGDPNLLSGQDPERISISSRAKALAGKPVSDALGRSAMNWLSLAVPSPAWAAQVFPDLPAEEQQTQLWESIFTVMRLNEPDPVAAWRSHIDRIVARCRYLSDKQYDALSFAGPGTELTVGLVPQHVWQGGSGSTQSGIEFTPNLPTEEIFTLPHRERTEGFVRATKPFSLRGVLVEDFSLTFRKGEVVDIEAAQGKEMLRNLIDTDAGAGRLGEVALVPHSSPISASGLVFLNTLYDENAACHIALGQAYKFSHKDGLTFSSEEFVDVGGNESAIHVDFMIGSQDLDVDGITTGGDREPLLRAGEWAFEL